MVISLIATTESLRVAIFNRNRRGRNRAGGGGGGGGPLRTGLAAVTSATWYSGSDDCVSYGMFQHETVSLDVHMYRLCVVSSLHIVHPFSISAQFVACTCKHACTMPSNHGTTFTLYTSLGTG